MPELPEVEVLVRHLDPLLQGKRIDRVQVYRPRVVRPHSKEDLESALLRRRIEKVERRAKFLLFHLRSDGDRQPRLVVGHLGMTGRMFLQPRSTAHPKHAAVVLGLGPEDFIFEDPRAFGRFHLESSTLEGLGPEPLGSEFTVSSLAAALRPSKQAIKVKLLDQSFLAGVGNIYASEALFRAGISPRRPANRVRGESVGRLHEAIRQVLSEAVAMGSSLPLDFREGAEGLFYYGVAPADEAKAHDERFSVYDRKGQPCARCGTAIRQIVQASRSTYFCPQCQKD